MNRKIPYITPAIQHNMSIVEKPGFDPQNQVLNHS